MTRSILSLLLIILLGYGGCSRKDDSVIECGSYRISRDEFLVEYARYQMQPHTRDNDSTRIEYAKYLMNRKLLAQLADSLGISRDTLVIQDQRRYLESQMRELYIKERVQTQIPPLSDSLCRDIYMKMQEPRRIRHLVTRDSATAWEWYRQLQSKTIRFEQLAEQCFQDTTLRKNGGSLGMLNWDQLDYPLAQTAFRMEPGELSPPVKNGIYYHILQVEGILRGVFTDESAYQNSRNRIYAAFKESLFRNKADSVVRSLVTHQDIRYDQDRMNSLDRILDPILSHRPEALGGTPSALGEDEMQTIVSRLHSVYDKPVAACNRETVTVRDLISHLPYLDKEIIRRGSREILGYYLRDREINRLAHQENLQQRPEINRKAALYRDNVYSNLVHSRLIRSVEVLPSEIDAYYRDHKDQFDANGIPSLELEWFSGPEPAVRQAEVLWRHGESPDRIIKDVPGLVYRKSESVTRFSDSSLYRVFYLLPAGTLSSPIMDGDTCRIGRVIKRETVAGGIEAMRDHIRSTLLASKRDSLMSATLDRCKPCRRYRINRELLRSLAR
ncbi:MAG: peptidylprolyl isomerase [Candidatus Delongbacteria bacterium]|nr:peptidylprolyl isomerase [Candidatus Delongbacteria bacterium]